MKKISTTMTAFGQKILIAAALTTSAYATAACGGADAAASPADAGSTGAAPADAGTPAPGDAGTAGISANAGTTAPSDAGTMAPGDAATPGPLSDAGAPVPGSNNGSSLPLDSGSPTSTADAGHDAGSAKVPSPYSLSDSFSAVSNPASGSQFTFGYQTQGGTFEPYLIPASFGGLAVWQSTAMVPSYPLAGKNDSPQATTVLTAMVPAYKVLLIPGANGTKSMVRWTCPASATYHVEATFTACDTSATSGASVRKNGMDPVLFVGDVTTAASAAFKRDLALVTGDLLDFGVDYGSNRSANYDNTCLELNVTPE